jgi:hypothetical protein
MVGARDSGFAGYIKIEGNKVTRTITEQKNNTQYTWTVINGCTYLNIIDMSKGTQTYSGMVNQEFKPPLPHVNDQDFDAKIESFIKMSAAGF